MPNVLVFKGSRTSCDVIKFSGPEKGVITKGVLSLAESLESLENGRILLCFPQSGGSLETLESLNSLESLENGRSEKTPFPKDPFFRTRSLAFLGRILAGKDHVT